jgi:hypothetical protein
VSDLPIDIEAVVAGTCGVSYGMALYGNVWQHMVARLMHISRDFNRLAHKAWCLLAHARARPVIQIG